MPRITGWIRALHLRLLLWRALRRGWLLVGSLLRIALWCGWLLVGSLLRVTLWCGWLLVGLLLRVTDLRGRLPTHTGRRLACQGPPIRGRIALG